MPEDCQLPQQAFDTWSAPLAETGASESQIVEVGVWYAQHHKTAPALPHILRVTRKLLADGSLPPHRLVSEREQAAMALLRAAEQLGLDTDDCAAALLLAGTLAHHATYRRSVPDIEREDLSTLLMGIVRLCDYSADEILDEIQAGRGQLAERQSYLFPDGADDE